MYRFLIVNEDITERRDMHLLLQDVGIECDIYETDSLEGIADMVNGYGIDIILLNVDLGVGEEAVYAENLIHTFEWIKVIVVSNRKDFECVRTALRIGAADYLTDTVGKNELSDVINRITNRMDVEKTRNNINSRGREYVAEHMLYLAVNGATLHEIEEYSNGVVDTEFINEYSCMILIDFNDYFFGKNGNNFKTEFVNNLKDDVAYLNLNQQQSVFFYKGGFDNYTEKAEELIKDIYNRYNEKCFAAVSGRFEGFEGIAGAMEEVDNLIENKFYHEPGEVFTADKVYEPEEDYVEVDDDTLIKNMKQAVKLRDIHGLRMHFESFCLKYRNKTNFSQLYIKFLFANLLKDFKENIPDTDVEELNAEVEVLYKALDFNTVIDIVNKNIDRLEDVFIRNPRMVHKEIGIVKEYIYGHYGEEISVEMLGEMVFLAPSYLSYLFKKETGQNLSKFIKAYRMERAKDMLEHSVTKISDVSIMCGYPNVSYFCSSFREYFGVSPQKYREDEDKNSDIEYNTVEAEENIVVNEASKCNLGA